MAITFVGSYVGTHAATSAQTVNFSNLRDASNNTPTLAEGDLVLVAVENASTVDRTQAQLTPSGYTALHTDYYRNDSNDSNFLVSRKFMGSTPDTSVAIPASNATTAGVAYAIYVFRGVDATTPMDATPVVTGATNTGVANAPAITPVTAGAWIVVFGGAAVAAGAVFTNPAGMSTTTNHFRSATITTTTNDANIGGAIYTGWTSGSYDPAAFGGSTSTNTGSWSAVTLALRPILDPVTGNLDVTESGSDTADMAGTVADPTITGTLAATESGADTASLSGTVSDAAITGSLAATETGSDTASLAGLVLVDGALASTEAGSDTASLAGDVLIDGALAATETGQDTASIAGDVFIQGALSVSEVGADTASLAGDVIVQGALATTEAGADTASFGGDTVVQGSLAATETGSDTASFQGAGATPSITGSIAATEAGTDTSAISGKVVLTGAFAVIESGTDTASMAGLLVSLTVTGSLSATESGSDTAAFYEQEPPPTPAITTGSIVRPRRGFRPSILVEFEDDLSASVVLASQELHIEAGSLVASSPDPISSRASLFFTKFEAYSPPSIRARTGWNDPSDEEMALILDFALD